MPQKIFPAFVLLQLKKYPLDSTDDDVDGEIDAGWSVFYWAAILKVVSDVHNKKLA